MDDCALVQGDTFAQEGGKAIVWLCSAQTPARPLACCHRRLLNPPAARRAARHSLVRMCSLEPDTTCLRRRHRRHR